MPLVKLHLNKETLRILQPEGWGSLAGGVMNITNTCHTNTCPPPPKSRLCPPATDGYMICELK